MCQVINVCLNLVAILNALIEAGLDYWVFFGDSFNTHTHLLGKRWRKVLLRAKSRALLQKVNITLSFSYTATSFDLMCDRFPAISAVIC